MNKLEAIVYDLVKSNPRFKNMIRNAYQLIMALIPVKKVVTDYQILNRPGYFFGFHDKIPFSVDNKKLLAHKYYGDDRRRLRSDDWVEIGFFKGNDYLEFKSLAKSYAWNWNQGSMLQWLGKKDCLIFNDFDGKKHIARVVDTEGNLIKVLPLAVGAVSPDGKKALSYDFSRLRIGMPGYGYANGTDPDQNSNIPGGKGSGLKLIDLTSGEAGFLFSVSDIAAMQPEATMEGAFHYFTHCLFNPSGSRFAFFHRWLIDDNKRYTRMISSDLNGNNIFIFPTAGMVSHYAWRDEQHILAYARTKQYDDHYYLFQDRADQFKIIGENYFKSDGHPQFSPDGRYLLTDTYPDRFRRQHLMIYDLETEECRDLARLQLPIRYIREPRCDFHPRWNWKSDMVCFDSAHSGVRSLCTINLSG